MKKMLIMCAVALAAVCARAQDLYCVIDLSGGTSAKSYPVTYLDDVPTGGWSDEYKTAKLVLRKISAGTFTMGSPTDEVGRFDDETRHQVTLTKDYYVGVFEVTQRQWELVMGTRPSYFDNDTYYAPRPVEQVAYDMIRGSSAGAGWPSSSDVDPDSFLGIIRAKSGLHLDLPTEAQWEYACRAGTTTALNSGKNLTSGTQDVEMDKVGRYYYNGGSDYSQSCDWSVGSAKVGSYAPNDWGLYDMHGNVWEWCLDWGGSYSGDTIDPKGPSSGSWRMMRGGCWIYSANTCRSAYRYPDAPWSVYNSRGFRLCCSDEKPEGGPYKETVEGVEWTFMVVNGEASVGGGSSSSTAVPTSTTGDIAIPSSLGGRPVTCIGGSAFCDCTGLASLTIHQDVTNVGYRAFEYWGKSNSLFFEGRPLQGIDMAHISSGVKLWYNGQYYTEWNPHIKTCVWTNAKSYIPFPPVPDGGPYKENVDGIEWMFFVTNGEACVGTGTAYSAVPETTKGAITVPSMLGGCAVTGIANSAFSSCTELTGVTIPEGVASLGHTLLYRNSKITELAIPASVTNIAEGAFYACFKLRDINVAEGNRHYVSPDGVLYTRDGTSLVCCPAAKTSVSLSESLTNICSMAFGECGELESIELPPNLATLGNNVFYSCKITKLTFPSSLVRIGGNLFPGCSLLTTFYFKGAPPERIEHGGFKTNATIWYNVKYFDEWQPVIKQCGWTNARPYNPTPGFMLFLR